MRKAITAIVSAGIVASLSTAVIYFPDVKVLLVAAAGLVTAIATYLSKE